MKKLVILAVLSLLGIPRLAAQDDYEYVPFVREGVKWVCFYNNEYRTFVSEYYQCLRTYFTLEIKGDAVIGDHTYKAMHKYSGQEIDADNDTILAYLREEDKVVYALIPDKSKYQEFYVGRAPQPDLGIKVESGKEFKLYDFNDPNEFYSPLNNNIYPRISYNGEDWIAVGDRLSRRHAFRYMDHNDVYIIEGIGVDGNKPGYPLYYLWTESYEPTYYLSHVIEDGRVVYEGLNKDYVVPWDGRMPIVREGMKWVNEHVVISHGDTTSYYYTYEIKGEDPRSVCNLYNLKQCHYYRGQEINDKNDSVICLLKECAPDIYVYCYENDALDYVEQNGLDLLSFNYSPSEPDLKVLYRFEHDGLPTGTVAYYMHCDAYHENQPRILSRNNFFKTEDVEVDGQRCNRFVYVDEQGEPVAYVVEGIGFDSRDMGDLLTPFTRRPDPDADYQEYWGLSHVIKDGEIIYKGMRYNEERVQAMAMDINGDGIIDVADVTTLIAQVLQDGNTPSINGSGNADVGDVVRLIDYVLHH